MVIYNSDWPSPLDYIWRKTTFPILASEPYFSEHEILTEELLINKIQKLNEYEKICFNLLIILVSSSAITFIICGAITAIFFASLTPDISVCLLLVPATPVILLSPTAFMLKNISKALEEAENKFRKMQSLYKQHKRDSQKKPTASIIRRPLLLTA